jgi:SAM-dependent methyltransferase
VAEERQGDRRFLEWLRAEEAVPFKGWDFSHLQGRMIEEQLPWDYARIVLDALPAAEALLDMGTGGGEFLNDLRPLPPYTRATEGYAPNIRLARERLEPLGVKVYEVEDDTRLPFGDAEFDLVINRHESYEPAEVRRILHPGGRFVTQQVGGQNNTDLNALLGAPEVGDSYWDLAHARRPLEDAGFEVREAREAFPLTRFSDVGAIVYLLKAIPWQIADFSVDRYFDGLKELEQRAHTEGYIAARGHRFLLDAIRPI